MRDSLLDSVSDSSSAAATGVPNIAPIMPAVASPSHSGAPLFGIARVPSAYARPIPTPMIGFSGPRLTPPASIRINASNRLGSTDSGSGASTSPSVAGSGPAWPGTFHTTRPTATPVSVSTSRIHSGEVPETPSACGMIVHHTSCNPLATALTESRITLEAMPTTRAGITSGSSTRTGEAGAAGAVWAIDTCLLLNQKIRVASVGRAERAPTRIVRLDDGR